MATVIQFTGNIGVKMLQNKQPGLKKKYKMRSYQTSQPSEQTERKKNKEEEELQYI